VKSNAFGIGIGVDPDTDTDPDEGRRKPQAKQVSGAR
jgi:hypothetical protein